MLYQLEGKFKANLKAHKKSVAPSEQNSEFNKRTRKLTQRVEDVKRLQRVELIYVSKPGPLANFDAVLTKSFHSAQRLITCTAPLLYCSSFCLLP
jgi:hypothetical protein